MSKRACHLTSASRRKCSTGYGGVGDRNAIELGEIDNSKIAIVLVVCDTSPISFCFFCGCRSRPDRSFRIPKRSVVRSQPRFMQTLQDTSRLLSAHREM